MIEGHEKFWREGTEYFKEKCETVVEVDEDGNMKFLQGTGLPKQPEGPPPRKIIGQSMENE